MRNSKISTHVALIALFLLLAFSRQALADLIDPDPVCLLEAQQMALDLSDQLRPPTDLTERIYNDLAAIRSCYPEFADITYRPHATPDEVMVGLTQEAAEQFRNGQYHALDELNQLYGVIAINDRLLSFISVIILKFNQVYNTNLLSDIYAQAEGVRHAHPNHIIGDGSTIDADPPFYTFILAWGDCPAGCIYREFHHFKVEDGCVTVPDERYVDALNGDDDNYGLTTEHAFATIQTAIDAASDGDTVIVADGTYTGIGNRDIDFLGKAITVRSQSGPDNCIIDCNGSATDQHRAFRFYNGEGHNSVLVGFTIINSFDWDGGAIRCYRSSPIITNCTFTSNTSGGTGGGGGGGIACTIGSPMISDCTFTANIIGNGGGISCMGGSPTITNCIFNGNIVGKGGGIFCIGSSPTIANCTISGNTGGAIYCYESSPTIVNCNLSGNTAEGWVSGGVTCSLKSNPKIINCTISGNSADLGGGICSVWSSPIVTNCTISSNTAEDEGGAIFCLRDSNLKLTNSILWDNTAIRGNEIYLASYTDYLGRIHPSTLTVSYSDVKGGFGEVYVEPNCALNWALGNIDADPCFTEVGYWDVNGVWVDGDYRLWADSPCIDAGDPNYVPEPNETDLDGKPRVLDGNEDGMAVVDMGAYEFGSLPALEAVVNIRPNTLNLRGKGKSFICRISLPEGYSVADIDPDSILLEDEIEPERVWLLRRFAVAKFSRPALQGLLTDIETPTTIELLVSGQLNDATPFEGTDTIRVIGKGLTRGRRINSNSKVVDGIEYYIQTDKAVYNLGGNVEMLYRVTNLGDQEVSLWFPHSPVYNFWVAKDGQDIWQAVNGWWDVITTLVLAPGESKEFPDYYPPQIWDMRDRDGNLVGPGKYTVTGGLYAGSGLWDFTRVSVDIRIISGHVAHKEVDMDTDTIRVIDKPRKNLLRPSILKRKR
jgi:parallel beta-helix repeat protein/predicted outer membrane repeat protein